MGGGGGGGVRKCFVRLPLPDAVLNVDCASSELRTRRSHLEGLSPGAGSHRKYSSFDTWSDANTPYSATGAVNPATSPPTAPSLMMLHRLLD